MKKVKVIITGRVQGVGFRALCRHKAKKLGVRGWVKNVDNDKVEAVFEADEEKVNQMIEWCWQGPTLASVSDINIIEGKPEGFKDFKVYK